tara:strand:- start:58335 stop:58877 length:543 start_codon:yes stop_codon:yes gene_type:complete
MSNSEAKLHLSISEGVFEISGSELFVSQQIENFRDIILKGLMDTKSIEENTLTLKPNENTDSVKKENCKNYPNIFHIEENEVKIIKKMPGNNNAKKSVNTALAYLMAMRTLGVDEVPVQDIREQCQEQGCLDANNFASSIKNVKEFIILKGEKGSNSKTCKLTVPGIDQATSLLEEINGE